MKLEIHVVVSYDSGRVMRYWTPIDTEIEFGDNALSLRVDAVRADGKLVTMASEKEVVA